MEINASLSEKYLLITGLGVVSGAGLNCKETKTTLFSKSIRPRPVGLTIEIDNTYFENKMENLRVNQLALHAVHEALQMAAITEKDIQSQRVGVCLGSTVGCYNFEPEFTFDYNLKKFPNSKRLISHFKNNTAQFIAQQLQACGPIQLISNACTSGADAIAIGAGWLRADLCDIVICGGVEVILPQIYAGFKSMQLCAPELCKPFDRDRQGLTLGEGAGFLILEKSTSPRKPQAHYLGYMSASDAYHTTAPHPEARGLARASQNLLKILNHRKIDFINAHGTATKHNDLAEGIFLQKQFSSTPVVATKGYTGHTLAAAGAIEAVFSILSLQEKKLPISKGFKNLDPEINFTPTQEILHGDFNTALSFSLGFGGTNSVLALGSST